MTDELKKICEDIKRLVPPSLPQEPTGQFETFIRGLKGKVKDSELDAIHRAYNYFNQLLGTPGVRPETMNETKNETKNESKNETKNESKNETKNEIVLDQATKEDMIQRLLLMVELI